MLKVKTSYDLRGDRVHADISIPRPDVQNLTAALKHVAWVAGRTAPEIEVIES
jgi:hypothetical protein